VLPAEESSVTAKVNGTEAPAAGAAGIVNAEAAAPLKLASVPLNTVVEPEEMTRFIFAQRSVAVPFTEPFADWVHVAPGVSVNVEAFAVPVFLIEIAVVTVLPGVIVVLPPNLLIVEHVAEFVETEPPSVLVQVTVPPAFCSCIVSVPLAAVLLLLVMLAANPERVPVSERESSTAAKMPARSATGANRIRFRAEVRSLSDTGTSSVGRSGKWRSNRLGLVCFDHQDSQSFIKLTTRILTPVRGTPPHPTRSEEPVTPAPPTDPTDAADLIAAFDAVVRANASLVGQLSARAGVHENALRALVLVSDTGYSTPTEVAGYLGLTSGAVTNMIDRMTAADLLERAPNPNDRRGSLLRLLPEGERVVREHRERYAQVLAEVDRTHAGGLLAVLTDLATGLYGSAGEAMR